MLNCLRIVSKYSHKHTLIKGEGMKIVLHETAVMFYMSPKSREYSLTLEKDVLTGFIRKEFGNYSVVSLKFLNSCDYQEVMEGSVKDLGFLVVLEGVDTLNDVYAVDPYTAVLVRFNSKGEFNLGGSNTKHYEVIQGEPGTPVTFPVVTITHVIGEWDSDNLQDDEEEDDELNGEVSKEVVRNNNMYTLINKITESKPASLDTFHRVAEVTKGKFIIPDAWE